MNCDILKSKLILCEWNAFYFIEIAFIGFTLHSLRYRVGTPGTTTKFRFPPVVTLDQYEITFTMDLNEEHAV